MFQFPRLPSIAYEFSDERRRIAGVRLSHSEIRGSMPVQRLTAAYRSRPRPSSAPGAKASTVCPYYLDGELPTRETRVSSASYPAPSRSGKTRKHSPAHRGGVLGLVQFSRSTEATKRGSPAGVSEN